MIIAWLPLAVLAYFMLAVNGTIDRIIVHKEVTKPVVVSFWVAAFSVPTIGLLLIGLIPLEVAEQFRFEAPDNITLLKIIVSGFLVQASLLFMYRALHDSEATRVLSIMGAVTPIVTLIASYFWLNERLGTASLLAVVLLIGGTVALTRGGKKKKRAIIALWLVNAIWAAILLAVQSVMIKQVYDDFHFISAYSLMAIGALFYLGVLVIFSPTVRRTIMSLGKKPTSRTSKKSDSSGKQVLLIFVNSMVGGLAVIILNLAIKLGSPSLVNSLRGVQYGILFVIALFLAKKHAHLLDEELSKRTVFFKISGILLITAGVAVLAIWT